ncbi:hypothetical protein [Megamonas funiformis]|uniref:hypothetical protein n=1 Tax=Megamonas funiformis TaxID=437897 RepID=UPI00265CFA93|nr:hypothetical protein [Megamonas funiformis]
MNFPVLIVLAVMLFFPYNTCVCISLSENYSPNPAYLIMDSLPLPACANAKKNSIITDLKDILKLITTD